MNITYHPRLFNPLYWHLKPLLRNPNIRFIYIEGGSSAAKTHTICQALETEALEEKYSSLVFRRYHVHIKDTIYSSFKAAMNGLELGQFFKLQEDLFKPRINEAKIRFRGLDDEENIKGIEGYDLIFNNEWSQFAKSQWDQQRKRLRGRPNQKFICDWNPISSELWQYKEWLDLDTWHELPLTIEASTKYSSLNSEFAFKRINERGDSVWIKVTYRDNYWVVGHPSGKGGFVDNGTLNDFEHDRIHKPNMYRVYANGERGVMRTGGEFWKQFDETKHVKKIAYRPGVVYVSLDENVNPYVTQTIWQLDGTEIRQIHEILSKAPYNNAPKAAAQFCDWLDRIGHKDVVFVCGDPSASKRSTVDENSSSFYQKYIAVLTSRGYKVVNKVMKSAPEVALSGAFINDIYESKLYGWSIIISDTCTNSVADYVVVKEDAEGKMFKEKKRDPETKIQYEPHGHISDSKRYLVLTIMDKQFTDYKGRKKSNLINKIGYFR